MTKLVTVGAGFIGSNFVLNWLQKSDELVVNLDASTYAGNLENLASLEGNPWHIFVQGDIGDFDLTSHLLTVHQPLDIVNLAAESHADHSIHGPKDFTQAKIVGTFRLLRATRMCRSELVDSVKPLKLKPKNIQLITTDEHPLPAPRTTNSRLATHKLYKTFSLRLPLWQDGLDHTLQQIS